MEKLGSGPTGMSGSNSATGEDTDDGGGGTADEAGARADSDNTSSSKLGK